MAVLPEELPVVLTVFLGIGAWRISREKVLTRHVPAIEMLGAATILCVDKTGTLTQNKMALARICAADQVFDATGANGTDAVSLPEAFHETLEFAILASQQDPFDPMEMAIRESGLRLLANTEHLHSNWQLVNEYPLTRELLAMSRVWQSSDQTQYINAAGMRVVMITGDYPATARNIACQIGIESPEEIITGLELDALSDADLRKRIRTANIFCRVVPEQKLCLVNAYKSNGDIVVMTGDGVNDAPALKSAHIGIAMGARGTDVARESASLVLLNDDFSSIVLAVKLGRRIFDKLQKAIAFIIAVHIPIVGLSLIPVMMGWPIVLMPVP